MSGYFTREQWFALPLELRRRWWKETDWGANTPSVELLQEIMACIDKNFVATRNVPVSEG